MDTLAETGGIAMGKVKDLALFEKLKPFMDKVSVGSFRPSKLFSLCVKASVVKCFEFNLHARQNTDDAFFSLPSLRGICEDLIVLNYIKGMPKKHRERLIQLLMNHDVASRIKSQDAFFKVARPQQPVLRLKNLERRIGSLKKKICAIWNKHGWPNLQNKTMPPVSQIADKQGQEVLSKLYDYLYRLTSAGVHFNVQSLLRSGWGEKRRGKFSTRNFNTYFSAYTRIYGAYLFCVCFEFFGKFLRPPKEVSDTIAEIRKTVFLESRWPEMVTFEEMNIKVPQDNGILRIALSFIQAEKSKGFVKK